MSFVSDLKGIVRREFKKYGIECNAEEMEVDKLAARYCEMLKRHIAPMRRTVHLSNEYTTFWRNSRKQQLRSCVTRHWKRERRSSSFAGFCRTGKT